MGPVRYRLRAEVRTRWRAWLGLAMLAGVTAGAVLTLIAGARRTDSAYSRFVRAQSGYDALVVNYPLDQGSAVFDFDELARLPFVRASARAAYDYTSSDLAYVAPLDGRYGTAMNRMKIVEGRAARPDRVEEMVVPFLVAQREHLHIGSRFALVNPAELEHYETEYPEQIAAARDVIRRLSNGTLKVVGIEASPGEFPPISRTSAPLHFTPAMARLLSRSSLVQGETLALRFRHGAEDDARFMREITRLANGGFPEVLLAAQQRENVERSIHVQAVGLRLLAALVALTGLLVLGQVFSRLSMIESDDVLVLSALGTTRRQRGGLGLLRASAIGAGAALIALAVAGGASTVFPTGLARTAEPDPGFAFDARLLLPGVVAVVLVLVALAAWPAWRDARVVRADDAPPVRASRLASALARSPVGPAAAAGVRMAIEPGRGRTAVPTRTSTAAVALGVAALVGAFTFGASLDHLVDTPRVYGFAWDLTLTNYAFGAPVEGVGAEVARELPGVRAVAVGDVGIGIPVVVNGASVDLMATRAVKGRIEPHLLDGRAPRAPDEIVLGAKSSHEIGAPMGSRVSVAFQGQPARRFRVVGRAVVPTLSDTARTGTGAWVTLAGERRLTRMFQRTADADAAAKGVPPTPVTGNALLVALEPGAESTAVVRAINRGAGRVCAQTPARCPNDQGARFGPVEGVRPVDVVDFGRVRKLPLVLGGVLALLAAATLVHVVVSATRRRRRDLAILKTLGFTRRQVRVAVAVDAATTTAMAVLVGVPLGIAAGRWLWSRRADALGVLNVPRVPWDVVAIVVMSALVLALLIAAFPARAAADTQPAVVLRSE